MMRMLDQVDDCCNVSFCVFPFVLAHTVAIFFLDFILPCIISYNCAWIISDKSITQKPFEFFCVAAFKKGPSIYPQCRKDVSNLSFAFYIFPLPAGVSLADDQVGGHRKLGAKNVGQSSYTYKKSPGIFTSI